MVKVNKLISETMTSCFYFVQNQMNYNWFSLKRFRCQIAYSTHPRPIIPDDSIDGYEGGMVFLLASW